MNLYDYESDYESDYNEEQYMNLSDHNNKEQDINIITITNAVNTISIDCFNAICSWLINIHLCTTKYIKHKMMLVVLIVIIILLLKLLNIY